MLFDGGVKGLDYWKFYFRVGSGIYGMDEESFRCPRCGSGNVIGYKGEWECVDCGFKWMPVEGSSIASDKQKMSERDSLAALLGVGFIIAGLAALIGGPYWYFGWRSSPLSLIELSGSLWMIFFCLLILPAVGIFLMLLGGGLLSGESKEEH